MATSMMSVRPVAGADATVRQILLRVDRAVRIGEDELRYQLEEQLSMVRGQYFQNAWTVFVHEHFEHEHGQTAKRQRDLVLALSDASVPRSKIRHLTPAIAEAYAGTGSKTISRDLNARERLGLIAREPAGVRPRKEVMLNFLPSVAGDGQILL